MTNREAIEILTRTQIYLGRYNGKTLIYKALIKAIAALVEKDEREQKAKALKEQHKNKCRDCVNFSYGSGGLDLSCGNCAIRDGSFQYNRSPNNKACKQFEYDEEAADNDNK